MENNKMFELMEKMYIEMQNIKNEVQETRKIVTKIEVDHGKKLEALFDGYKQNTETLEIIDEKVDKLQIDVNALSMKTASNDTRIIELSRNLKKVK